MVNVWKKWQKYCKKWNATFVSAKYAFGALFRDINSSKGMSAVVRPILIPLKRIRPKNHPQAPTPGVLTEI